MYATPIGCNTFSPQSAQKEMHMQEFLEMVMNIYISFKVIRSHIDREKVYTYIVYIVWYNFWPLTNFFNAIQNKWEWTEDEIAGQS